MSIGNKNPKAQAEMWTDACRLSRAASHSIYTYSVR